MRSALLIAAKDIRLRIRDRSALIIGVVAPLTLAFIFNLILGGALSGDGPDLEYGLIDEDRSDISESFAVVLASLEEDGIITLTRFDDPAGAREAVQEGEISAFFHIPTGFGDQVASGSPAIAVVGDVDSPNATQIAASIARQFGSGVEAARLAVITTATELGVLPTPDFVAGLTTDPATAAFTFQLNDIAAATRQLDASTYFAAGMAIFFMFFTVQYGVMGLLDEEREGTMARLLGAPIQRGSVVVGKAILSIVLGVTSMLLMVGGTTWIMGADWGPILGVLILVVSGVLAAVGLTGAPGAFARTAEGAGNLGSTVAVVLGLLGGVFFPLGQGEDLLSRMSLITPHAWFLRGLGDISTGSWTAALPAAGVLLLFALVSGTVAAFAFARRLRR